MNPNDKDFNPGGIKDRYDNRDYQWSEIGYGAVPFNWNEGFDIETKLGFRLTVKDQNGSYSCGGQAWSYLAEILEALKTGTYEPRSAKYIYSQTYYSPTGGSTGRDNSNIFVKQGVATESKLSSMENGQPPSENFMRRTQDITYDIRENAKLAVSTSYAQTGTSIDDIAQAIRENNGVILGVAGSNNGSWLSIYPKPPVSGETQWYHWVLACKAKLINGKKHIGFVNSWGKNTGDSGWQWLSEDYFAVPGAVWSGWTHVFAPFPVDNQFEHTFTRQLDYGMSDPEVMWLQKALKLLGYFPSTVNPTMFFGNITKQAVQKFQIENGIVSSGSPSTTGFGRLGPATMKKLNDIFSVTYGF